MHVQPSANERDDGQSEVYRYIPIYIQHVYVGGLGQSIETGTGGLRG